MDQISPPPSVSVEDFSVSSDQVESRVYGEPMHSTALAVLWSLKTDGLTGFLRRELRHAVGNYVTVYEADGEVWIITSPGYAGGYFRADGGRVHVATTLRDVLPAGPVLNEDAVAIYLHHPKNAYSQLPLSSLVQGVTRLPPASVLQIRDGQITAFWGYLALLDQVERPETFEAALGEVSDTIADYCTARKIRPAVSFSGGLDSLIIALTMRDRLGDDGLDCYVMHHHNLSNGVSRAWPVGNRAKLKVTPILSTHDGPGKIGLLKSAMRRDLVNTNAPHLGMIDGGVESSLILHGQNMDSMAGLNMIVAQVNHALPLMGGAHAGKDAKTDERQTSLFLRNLAFTEPYLYDRAYQAATQKMLCKHTGFPRIAPDPGGMGIWLGMLSCQYPNIMDAASYPPKQLDILTREVDALKPFMMGPTDPRKIVDGVRFYSYAHMTNKRLATFGLPNGGRPLLYPMSGPILSYFVGKARGLSDAASPKAEIYALAEKMTGMSYQKLAAPMTGVPPTPQNATAQDQLVDPASLAPGSRFLQALPDGAVKRWAEGRILPEIRAGISAKATRSTSLGRLVTNLDMILR